MFGFSHGGLSDLAEIQQGLVPLSRRGFRTGLIASLPLPGEAREVVIEGLSQPAVGIETLTRPAGALSRPTGEGPLNAEQQTAYLALGARGLGIVNVSQFKMPILLGQLELPGDATNVGRLGPEAFLPDR